MRTGRTRAMGVVLGALVPVLGIWGWAQDAMPEGPTRRFAFPVLDRQTLRRKALVRGDAARPLAREVYEIEGMRLEFFGADDRTNLVVTAPRCVCRLKEERVNSSERMEVGSPDGRFRLQGNGFSWVETDGLVVSNLVEAVVRKDLLREREGRVVSGAGAGESLEIRSDRFRYRAGLASFEDNVRVQDREGEIHSSELRLVLEAGAEGDVPTDVNGGLREKLRVVEAVGDVRVDSPELAASADRAVYEVAGERLELLGNPAWHAGGREGRAEHVEILRLRRELRASGGVQMRTPAEGFFADEELLTGGARARADAAAPRWLDIRSEAFALRPAPGRTNVQEGVFERQVRVEEEGKGSLDCGRLTIEYEAGARVHGEGASADSGGSAVVVRTAVAEQEVVLVQGSNRVASARGVYAAETRRLEMTGGVEWWLGGREGRSDHLVLDGAERTSVATGEVRMRLPAEALASASAVLAGRLGKTEEEAEAMATSGPVEVRCQEFAYRASREGTGLAEAVYRGGVEVRSPSGMQLTCQELRVWVDPDSNRAERMVADRNVVMVMEDAKGRRTARGDQAVYTAVGEELRLLGDRGVVMEWVSAAETNRATGRSLRYDGTRDRLELIGEAELLSEKGRLSGERLWVNPMNGLVSASGMWKIRLPARELSGRVALEGSPQ